MVSGDARLSEISSARVVVEERITLNRVHWIDVLACRQLIILVVRIACHYLVVLFHGIVVEVHFPLILCHRAIRPHDLIELKPGFIQLQKGALDLLMVLKSYLHPLRRIDIRLRQLLLLLLHQFIFFFKIGDDLLGLLIEVLALLLRLLQCIIHIDEVIILPLELVLVRVDLLQLLLDFDLLSHCLLERDVELGGDLVSQAPLLELDEILQFLDLLFHLL